MLIYDEEKNSGKLGLGGNFLNWIKNVYKIPITNIVLNDKELRD